MDVGKDSGKNSRTSYAAVFQAPATAIPAELTALPLAEAIETMCIHRVAGRTGARTALVMTRPCRASPQTLSGVGVIGGGQVAMSGEVSLAHHGMLVLDERPEFGRHVLEVLRQPLEEGVTSRIYKTVAAISGKKRSCLASTALREQ